MEGYIGCAFELKGRSGASCPEGRPLGAGAPSQMPLSFSLELGGSLMLDLPAHLLSSLPSLLCSVEEKSVSS